MSEPEQQSNSLRARLGELRLEREKGQRHLDLLDKQLQEVRDTLLRISGAIQVLEELLQTEASSNGQRDNKELENRVSPDELAAKVSI